MTVHYCDKCGHCNDWKNMVRVHAERESYSNTSPIITSIDRTYEVCEECYFEMFRTKKEYEFPPQTVEAISGVSPV